MRLGLRRITNRILISENGLGEYDKVEKDGSINDDYRIKYVQSHLKAIQEVITEGLKVVYSHSSIY